jgi:hypothetical protein
LCFQLTPYADTVRFMRLTSDDAPGMQGLFVRWRAGSLSYQVLGSGVRTAHLSGATRDISFSGVRQDTGSIFAFVSEFNPQTVTGPWTVYDSAGASVATGTLTKISCSTAAVAPSSDNREAGLGGADVFSH